MLLEKNAIYNVYHKRFVDIKKENGIADAVLRENLSVMKEHGASDNVIDKWVRGYRNVPVIGALAIVAYTLKTSCGYLIGQHDMKAFSIEKSDIDITISDLNDMHKEMLGKTIYMNEKITPSWVNSKRKTGISPMDQTRTYIKIAVEIGVCVDYLLGLTPYKDEKEYAYYSGAYSPDLGGSVLVIEPGPEYGIISADGMRVFLKDGNSRMVDALRKDGAKLAKKIVY